MKNQIGKGLTLLFIAWWVGLGTQFVWGDYIPTESFDQHLWAVLIGGAICLVVRGVKHLNDMTAPDYGKDPNLNRLADEGRANTLGVGQEAKTDPTFGKPLR